jgi:hypothetical protein
VYDVTYGVIKPYRQSDCDDSIVRNNIKDEYLKMMDRLNPKQIVVVSSTTNTLS